MEQQFAEPVADKQRLPSGAKPIHYDLRLKPNIDAGTFQGRLVVHIGAAEDLTALILNAKDLNFVKTEVFGAQGSQQVKVENDDQSNQVTLSLSNPIKAGQTFELYMDFTGIINESGTGLFRSRVSESSSWTISTDMEPTEARTVFPCFDEPAFKATFSLSLVVNKSLTCLSNMPIASEQESKDSPSKKLVEFKKSPPMSTYLLALAIGYFSTIETTKYRCAIRVHAPKEYDIEDAHFALEIAAKALEIHEKTFDIEFPLPKMDLLVVPGSNGAMENWGLCTFQPRYLLVGPNTKASDKLTAAFMIVHELAHQWFGNLVTMHWWNDLWLKEAFADWAAFHALSQIEGFEDSWREFVTDGMQMALFSDSNRASHSIQADIQRASDIRQIFDPITYKKGCAILRMISNYLQEDLFIKGVQLYLKGHVYGNATTLDLWKALGRAAGTRDVKAFAEVWTKNVGYPIVTIKEEGFEQIRVTQTRFLVTVSPNEKEDSVVFPIILKPWEAEGPPKHIQDMEGSLLIKSRVVKHSATEEIFKLNRGQFGFYRVAYNLSLWKRVLQDLEKGNLDVEDRVGIITDIAALALAGHPFVKTTDLLELLRRFEKETSYFVWKMVFTTLGEVAKTLMFEQDGSRDGILEFQRQLGFCFYAQAGKGANWDWTFDDTDSIDEQRFKALMFGNCVDDRIRSIAFGMFQEFVQGDYDCIHSNIRTEVFRIVLQAGGAKEYRKLYSILQKQELDDPVIRTDILHTLGYSNSLPSIQKTLQIALSPTSVSQNEVFDIIQPLTTHKQGINVLWHLLKSGDWMKIPNLSLWRLAPIIQVILMSFTKEEQAVEVELFFEKVDTTGLESILAQCLDGIRARARWVGRDHDEVVIWLKKNGYWKEHIRGGGIKESAKRVWRSLVGGVSFKWV